MKSVIYSHETIENIISALEKIEVRGVSQAKLIVYINSSLESGEVKNIYRAPEAKEGEQSEIE